MESVENRFWPRILDIVGNRWNFCWFPAEGAPIVTGYGYSTARTSILQTNIHESAVVVPRLSQVFLSSPSFV